MSYPSIDQVFPRGKTHFDGRTPVLADNTNLEGLEVVVLDSQHGTNRPVTLRCVRNVSTVALSSKRSVRWKAGFEGLRVDGYTAVDNAAWAGVVDDAYGTDTIPVNDLFWIVTSGPCLAKNGDTADATAVVAVGDLVGALTAAASTGGSAGALREIVLTGATDPLAKAIINHFGTALSALTTAQTGQDFLVLIRKYY